MTTPSSSTSLDNNPSNTTLIGNPGTNDMHDVIGFTSEGLQKPLEMDYNKISKLQVEAVGDKRHEIHDILSRPIKILEFELKSTDFQGIRNLVVDVLAVMIQNSKNLKNKLDAYYGIRGTFCIRVVINPTPFQTGLYMLMVHPTRVRVDTASNWVNRSLYTELTGLTSDMLLTNYSGHPNVLLNVGATSEVTIKVPYVGQRGFIPLTEISSVLAQVVCCTPIRGPTNGESVGASMYAWMEDVDLLGAAAPAMAFSNFPGSRIDQVTPQSDSSMLQNIISALSNLQSPSQSEEAAQQSAPATSSGGGAVSGIADTVGSIASGLTAIPGVADIAGPVSWVAKGVSSVAKMFGFSKPHDPTPAQPVFQNPFREFAHVDSVSSATKISLSKDSAVQVRSLGPVAEDELSIPYLIQRPNLYAPFTWKLSDPVDKVLAKIPISPAYFFKTREFYIYEYGNGHVRSETFLSFLSSLFMFWRGSIMFTFTFAANKFYSGRLRIVYQLDQSSTIDPPSGNPLASDYGYYYSDIIDLRDANTITYGLPYIDVNPFRTTVSAAYPERQPYLWIIVEKALVASSTVSDTIECWMSVSGGDDFVFAGPRLDNQIYLMPKADNIVGAPTKQDEDEIEVEPQGFTQNQTAEERPAVKWLAPQQPQHSNAASFMRAVGDPVVSLRSLCHRPIEHERIGVGSGTYSLVNPWNFIVDTKLRTTGTYIDFVRSMYRFVSGGMRVNIRGLDKNHPYRFKLVDTTQFSQLGISVTATGLGGYLQCQESSTTSEDSFSNLPTIADLIYREDLQGMASFELPYYTIYEMLDNTPYTSGTQTTWPNAETFRRGEVALMWYNPVNCDDVSIYVTSADDFSCGYLIGAPITYGTDAETYRSQN